MSFLCFPTRSMPTMKTLPLLVCAALCLPVLALARDNKDKEAVPDANISQVSVGEIVNGVPFAATDMTGKAVVIEQWGVNCAPCIASLPEMAKLAKRYEAKGLVVVGIHAQEATDEQINKILKDARVKYPVARSGNVPVQTGGIPHVLVFGKDGKLKWHGNPNDDSFLKAVREAVK